MATRQDFDAWTLRGHGAGPLPADVGQLREDLLRWQIASASQLADGAVGYVFDQIGSVEEELREELRDEHSASLEANIIRHATLMLRAQSPEEVTLATETLHYVRRLARRGVPLNSVLRAIRYGIVEVWRLAAEKLLAQAPAESGPLIVQWTEHWLNYVNWFADAVVGCYAEEREQWVRSANALRMDTVQEILRGEPVDVDVASARLGYELRRPHRAIVAWADPAVADGEYLKLLEALIADAAAAFGQASLVLPDGMYGCWAWISPRSGAQEHDLADLAVTDGLHLAVGRCGTGLHGFRSSHRDAVEARRVARLADDPEAVTLYESVELIALMSKDLDRARDFVLGTLGPLAETDPATSQLRETLLAYLQTGNSKLSAAARLAVHQHTVSNRLRRIEEVLGYPLESAPLVKVHTALILARYLDTRVLA